MLYFITHNLINAKSSFIMISPSWPSLIKPRWIKTGFKLFGISKIFYDIYNGAPPSEKLGGIIGSQIFGKTIGKKLKDPVKKAHNFAQKTSIKTCLISRRSWPINIGKRNILTTRIAFHNANKAKMHLDVHIGRFSFIARISGKPVEKKLSQNASLGKPLTENDKKLLLEHLKSEISNHSRFAQNLDHTMRGTKENWFENRIKSGYGSGPTRQIILEDESEIYKSAEEQGGTFHLYLPSLFSDKGIYVYKIYNSQTPILIIGKEKNKAPTFPDRLHLKMLHSIEEFRSKVNKETITRKYDGASAHFVMSESGVTRLYSPRFSKKTGERIEYSFKVPEICKTSPNGINSSGMGELLFWKFTPLGRIFWELFDSRGPENWTWKYLTAAEIGGILNSRKIRSSNIFPDFMLYRINTKRIEWRNFFKNRILQELVCKAHPEVIRPVSFSFNNKANYEGFIGVADNRPIEEGFKFKFVEDAQDWEVIENNLFISEKGNPSGVVRFKNLNSGKYFNLGPGQLGDKEECLRIIDSGDNIIGVVAKVTSRRGHEGRASKRIAWHPDKGSALPWQE